MKLVRANSSHADVAHSTSNTHIPCYLDAPRYQRIPNPAEVTAVIENNPFLEISPIPNVVAVGLSKQWVVT